MGFISTISRHLFFWLHFFSLKREKKHKMTQISRLERSQVKDKKYVAIFDNGKRINFGSSTSTTFVEGASKEKKVAYIKRHLANEGEKNKIQKLIPSPALLSYYLLWNTNDLQKNIRILNGKLKSV